MFNGLDIIPLDFCITDSNMGLLYKKFLLLNEEPFVLFESPEFDGPIIKLNLQ